MSGVADGGLVERPCPPSARRAPPKRRAPIASKGSAGGGTSEKAIERSHRGMNKTAATTSRRPSGAGARFTSDVSSVDCVLSSTSCAE